MADIESASPMGRCSLTQFVRSSTIVLSIFGGLTHGLGAYLFYSLPDDPYHIAFNLGAYSLFAVLLSGVGFVGAIKQHAFSTAIFSTFLLIDTILCAVPRLLLVIFISSRVWESTLCAPSSSGFENGPFELFPLLSLAGNDIPSASPHSADLHSNDTTPVAPENWPGEAEGCKRIAWLLQTVTLLGIVGATAVQFILALQIRTWANRLFTRELRLEELAREVQYETAVATGSCGPAEKRSSHRD